MLVAPDKRVAMMSDLPAPVDGRVDAARIHSIPLPEGTRHYYLHTPPQSC